MSAQLPTIAAAKAQARRLRERLNAEGTAIGHSQSLELVAHQLGFRDWNALHAAIGNRPSAPYAPGGRVRGHYLSQPFEGTVMAVAQIRAGWYQLELELDAPVDVVTFEGFSNFRKRIRGIVGPSGSSPERTSDGRPHLEIEM